MTIGVDAVLKAWKPIATYRHTYLSAGQNRAPLFDEPNRQPDVILITFEEFETVAQRLKGKTLEGTAVPKSTDEIPRLTYHDLVGGRSQR